MSGVSINEFQRLAQQGMISELPKVPDELHTQTLQVVRIDFLAIHYKGLLVVFIVDDISS